MQMIIINTSSVSARRTSATDYTAIGAVYYYDFRMNPPSETIMGFSTSAYDNTMVRWFEESVGRVVFLSNLHPTAGKHLGGNSVREVNPDG